MLCAADDAKEQKRKLVFPFQVVKMPTLDEFRHRIMMQKYVVLTELLDLNRGVSNEGTLCL